MTEQEYISTTELAQLRSALAILQQIVPENSIVIPPGEFSSIKAQIYKWTQQLNERISIDIKTNSPT
jgi:hypothetical protein